MRHAVAAFLALGLSASGWGQEARDAKDPKKDVEKYAKLKAPDLVRKILADQAKKKGCAIKEVASLVRGQQKIDTTFEGVMRKDFAAVKGSAEVYVRGKDVLVNVGGRFDPPDKLTPEESGNAESFKHPAYLLADAGKLAGTAAFAPDEAVDGKDCRVIDMLADEATLKQLLKEFAEDLNARMARRQGGGGGGLGLGGGGLFRLNGDSFDSKTSVSTFKLWVGKDDLNPYRLEQYLTPKLKPNAIPKEFMARIPEFQVKYDLLFSKWDEEIAYDLPAVIKSKWGIK